MIQIIPSITIIEGKVVRLKQGDFSSEKVYDSNPLDVAKRFEDHGIKVVHLVDLDGALKGEPVAYHALEAIAGHTNLEVDFTGGVMTDGDVMKAFEYGAKYITAGTIAHQDPEQFASWVLSYGREKMTLSADAQNNKIAVKGWQKATQIDLFEHIEFFYNRGLKYVKTTDISKDGVMEGPAFDLYADILKRFPNICILASGGVRHVDDIRQLNEMGVFAVIFGRAYYEGKIKLEDLKEFLV
ncbi:1-(5-phosphoribosyl)-5-[(5-phosphoribosylamino)methylideneamino] imidazole-4-carboxamide isomerase [Cytophagales bacterium LB-30]|uniref:1-(5-phosphoribosyl)-5-[(5-phosphoribosylamino)methylideneamino] imidazole-4-carboxamide isomerase n=1 Tax=Shiella aurantiaca TaxID=3058365 RepID=A0ABT8F239_9BACT|nr:1-(5-phosphoribosyl)-5-[(5-phosphoribosylamino)methylideneamino] imidazole-4-carboxamide isomerase [Shiella aurantiaca]MDN4164512.1 1-(5-phosphoribosyl)-5-[(5-phosphoribosylamino)methylideneamino] imidazole-4-carboxamide isomerase [Shiella aurantiaca]